MNALRIAVATLMLVYGTLHLWATIHYETMWLLVWVVPCFLGALGLFLSKAWSQYLVYLVGACAVAGWAGYMVLSISQETPPQYMQRLYALGAAFVVVWGFASFVVRRYFKNRAQQI
jgi:hypothetical protein